jgi:hypothetical protein
MTSAATAATTVTSTLHVRIRHKASHVLALLVSSVMEKLAHVQMAIDHRALGQLQFVSTSTSAAKAATTVTSMPCALTLQGASHANALLASSVMALLAAVHPATEPLCQEMLQFVSTSTSAAKAATTVTSTPCALTLQGASHAHAQQISPLWAQVHLDRHALAHQVLPLMATAQLQYVQDLQAPVQVALAIQLLLQIRIICGLLHAGLMELVGSRFMAVLIFHPAFLGALCAMMESQKMKRRLFVLILAPHTEGRCFLALVEAPAKSGWIMCSVPTGGA